MTENVSVSFLLKKNIHDKLEEVCERTGQNKSSVLRQAVFEYVTSMEIE